MKNKTLHLIIGLTIILWTKSIGAQSLVFKLDTAWQQSDLSPMRWVLKGDTLSVDNPEVVVSSSGFGFDTLYYSSGAKRNWDTILYHYQKADTFWFRFNTCCNAFDVYDNNKRRRVSPRLRIIATKGCGKTTEKLLARLGNTVSPIASTVDTLNDGCRSVLRPNIYNFYILAVTTCPTDSIACQPMGCAQNLKKYWGISDYEEEKTYEHFLYLPLSNELQTWYYDKKQNTIFTSSP